MPTSLSKWWGSFREMMIPKRQSRRQLICDAGITLGILAVAAAVCTLLTHMGDSDSAVPMVFMLAVLLVARLTDGFLFSLVATVVSVIGVNYAFTYPYFAFNFTITGYPLTFVTMFAVSIVVGMLTDQVKRQERVKSEAKDEGEPASLRVARSAHAADLDHRLVLRRAGKLRPVQRRSEKGFDRPRSRRRAVAGAAGGKHAVHHAVQRGRGAD